MLKKLLALSLFASIQATPLIKTLWVANDLCHNFQATREILDRTPMSPDALGNALVSFARRCPKIKNHREGALYLIGKGADPSHNENAILRHLFEPRPLAQAGMVSEESFDKIRYALIDFYLGFNEVTQKMDLEFINKLIYNVFEEKAPFRDEEDEKLALNRLLRLRNSLENLPLIFRAIGHAVKGRTGEALDILHHNGFEPRELDDALYEIVLWRSPRMNFAVVGYLLDSDANPCYPDDFLLDRLISYGSSIKDLSERIEYFASEEWFCPDYPVPLLEKAIDFIKQGIVDLDDSILSMLQDRLDNLMESSEAMDTTPFSDPEYSPSP